MRTILKSKMNIKLLLLLGMVALFQGCSQPKGYNIALKPNKNIQGQREDEKLLGEELTKRLGIPVKIITPANKTIIEAGLANKTLDIGYVSSKDAISFADNDVAEVLVAGQHGHRIARIAGRMAVRLMPGGIPKCVIDL